MIIKYLKNKKSIIEDTEVIYKKIPSPSIKESFMKLQFHFVGVLFLSLLNLAQAGEGRVGEIRYSILTIQQFQEKYGPEWELMKGQAIPSDSELLHLWGQIKVPDARGLFLRSSQVGREDEMGNPDGEVAVGAYQADSFKEHDHGGGNHNHSTSLELTASRNPNGRQCNTVAICHPRHQDVHSSYSGKIIKSEGAEETRPRCVTVNTFIKLRESAPLTPSHSITPELKTEIINSPEFKAAVEKILQASLNRLF